MVMARRISSWLWMVMEKIYVIFKGIQRFSFVFTYTFENPQEAFIPELQSTRSKQTCFVKKYKIQIYFISKLKKFVYKYTIIEVQICFYCYTSKVKITKFILNKDTCVKTKYIHVTVPGCPTHSDPAQYFDQGYILIYY